MTAADFTKLLIRLKACNEAREWAQGKTLRKAWTECPRGDWLLWLAVELKVDRKLLVLAACDCARMALKYVAAGEERPRVAIETAEAWCRGEATLKEVAAARASAGAAARAAWAAAGDAAGDAAWAAALAAGAAWAAARAAEAASQQEAADLVRARIPLALIEAAAKEKP